MLPVGSARTISENGVLAELHPVLLLRTVIVKLYACAVALAGMVMLKGELLSAALVTVVNPLMVGVGAAMLYWLGEPLVAV